jgi:transposase
MLIKTILNQVMKFKRFVYGNVRLLEIWGQKRLEIDIHPRANSKPICSGCGKKRKAYDVLETRHFEFIPFWGILVFFVYAMRRVDCPRCGIKVEKVPWSNGKSRITTRYAWFLSKWAKLLSWSDVARVWRTSWHNVHTSVCMAVQWGRDHMNLEGITAIGIDELQWKRGHKYITLIYQIDEGFRRLLWIGDKRNVRTLLRFFRWFGKERTARLKFICSDMWKAYLKVVKKKAGSALHILDRFHIVAHMNKAIDKLRANEVRELKKKGEEAVLIKSRWCFLKRPKNLTTKQKGRLSELLKLNLKTVRSYLLKEDFQFFWNYESAHWAGKFLEKWCVNAMRSNITPMKQVAKMLRKHKELLLNWFKAKKEYSSGVVEGLNAKAKLTMRKSYGYGKFEILQVSLYHTLGKLPEPNFTHRFF